MKRSRDLRPELTAKAALLGAKRVRIVSAEEMQERIRKASAIVDGVLARALEDPDAFDPMVHAMAAVMLARGAIAVFGLTPEWFDEMIRAHGNNFPDSVVIDMGGPRGDTQ
jgi:hypothetical protein